jgi:hypothetical protein
MTSPTDFSALADPSVTFAPPVVSGLTDDELLAEKVLLAEIRRRVDATDAVIAAELAHRSRPELGYTGLAQRHGARTPEKLIQTLTGVSARDARTQVRVGTMVAALVGTAGNSDEPESVSEPWLAPVAAAVASGALGLEAADAIRSWLGCPVDDVTADLLLAAASALVAESADLTVEELAVRARARRAELEVARIEEREAALLEKRSLTMTRLPDGMTRLVALLDPENAAQVRAIVDAATSPRLGGPRFVDEALAEKLDALLADPRTTEQVALDTVVELLRLGSGADVTAFIGARRPAAQVLVTLADLESGAGAAYFEGQTEPVSVATAQRLVCESGVQPILFGTEGNVLDLGRELRLFTRRQRIALAARDGGCSWTGCDRPPSWCEAHHINEWVRDRGRTDVDDGVLLCKHHHLLLHNNRWRIVRTGHQYALIPPADIDPTQTPRPVRSGSPARRRLLAGASA